MDTRLKMILLLAFGIATAIAHLLFYHSLDNKSVPSVSISQEWSVRIGTALAFLAKTCWTVAVIIAYTQHVWTTMDQKQLSSKTVDAMFTAITDFTNFRQWEMLRRAKLATALAIVAWCLPIPSVFTPATLTVVPVGPLRSQITEAQVPTVDFNDGAKFAALATCTADLCHIQNPSKSYGSAIQYRYPNAQTVVSAIGTTSSGSIKAIRPRYLNSTYTLTFPAPALKCLAANESSRAIIDRIDSSTAPPFNQYQGLPALNYYSFVPGLAKNGSHVPVDFANLPTTWDMIGKRVVPIAPEIWIKSGPDTKESYHVCALHNATYEASFAFDSGVQSNNVSVTYLNAMPYTLALLAPQNKMIPIGPEFQAFTYQAIWMTIAQQLDGRFSDNPLNTRVLQTPLVGSMEFRPYFGVNFGASEQPFASSKAIPQIVEELSQNITMSLFASRPHLNNGTQVQISYSEGQNRYVFDQRALLISYGISVLFTVFSVVIGMRAYKVNGGTRSLAYSALVEAAGDSKIGMSLMAGDGKDASQSLTSTNSWSYSDPSAPFPSRASTPSMSFSREEELLNSPPILATEPARARTP